MPASTALIYHCPMHPEIRKDHPGRCPKCQMLLVPEGAPIQEGHQHGHNHGHHHGHVHGESPGPHAASAHVDAPIEPPPAPAGTVYTCPMHPEVRQDHPGNCPKCGMTLEPIIPLDAEDNHELRDFQRRFWWTLPLTVSVTVLAMFGHRLGWFDMRVQTWVELVLSLPVVAWTGGRAILCPWLAFTCPA